MNAMTMHVVDTATLPLDRQIKSKKLEIDSLQGIIDKRTSWLQDPENKSRYNYEEVAKDRWWLEGKRDVAKYELSELEAANGSKN
jgi:hypothetical protein